MEIGRTSASDFYRIINVPGNIPPLKAACGEYFIMWDLMSLFCSYFVASPVFICLCGLFCLRGSECSDQLFVHLVKMICAVVPSAERNQISAFDTQLDV